MKFTVNGKEYRGFRAETVGGTEVCDALLPLVSEGGDIRLVLDGTSLCYEKYEIEVGKDFVRLAGSYASLSALSDIFAHDIKAGKEIKSVSGSIEKPKMPFADKKELLRFLEYMYKSDKMLFGEHLAGNMNPNEKIEKFYKAVGAHPSMMDFDMLRLKDNTQAAWSKALCEFVEFAEKGGVITTMHHWLNPIDPSLAFRGYLGTLDDWRSLLTDGTPLNLKWREELDRAGEFMRALQDAGVVFMYRPMHEVNGNWFWFCAVQEKETIPAEDVINMWKYVYNYYTENYGITNILWEYGPNITNSETCPLPIMYYYPGDEYVDVVGLDWYTDGDSAQLDGNGKCYGQLTATGKPFGLMEFGVSGNVRTGDRETQPSVFSCKNYVKMLDELRNEGKKFAFAEVYAGQYGAPEFIGCGEVLRECGYIVFLDEVKTLIERVI